MRIRINQPFNEQYTLILDSETKVVDVHMISKIKVRWDFSVLKVQEETLEVRLVLLEHTILEANNKLIKEIAQVSQLFSTMYNELHLIISHEGKVQQILNKEIISEKWGQVKNLLEKEIMGNPDLEKTIQLNDEMFSNIEKLKLGIENNEFFLLYFSNIYNKEIPYHSNNITKYNFFNTAKVQWEINAEILNESSEKNRTVSWNAKPAFLLSQGFYNRAYSQFSDKIDISKLFTLLREEGKYVVEKNTGKFKSISLKKIEKADLNLYTSLTYTLLSEELYIKELKKQPEKYKEPLTSNKKGLSEENPENKQEVAYKVYKGKKYSESDWKKLEEEMFQQYAEKHNLKTETKEEPKGRFFIEEKKMDKP